MYEIAAVPWPPVMVPFVIVHAYVAPAVAGTLALALAVEHIVAGAVIVATGGARTFAVAVPVLVQPPIVTVADN